jgi:hypothetical protein
MTNARSTRGKVVSSLEDYVPREVVVETFRAFGEPSSSSVRVRPAPEEGFPDGTRVQCSRTMRKAFPVGTRFRLYLTLRETGDGPCLYAHHDARYEVVQPLTRSKETRPRSD